MKNVEIHNNGHKFRGNDLMVIQAAAKEALSMLAQGLKANSGDPDETSTEETYTGSNSNSFKLYGCLPYIEEISGDGIVIGGAIYHDGEIYRVADGTFTDISQPGYWKITEEVIAPSLAPNEDSASVDGVKYRDGNTYIVHTEKVMVYEQTNSPISGTHIAESVIKENPLKSILQRNFTNMYGANSSAPYGSMGGYWGDVVLTSKLRRKLAGVNVGALFTPTNSVDNTAFPDWETTSYFRFAKQTPGSGGTIHLAFGFQVDVPSVNSGDDFSELTIQLPASLYPWMVIRGECYIENDYPKVEVDGYVFSGRATFTINTSGLMVIKLPNQDGVNNVSYSYWNYRYPTGGGVRATGPIKFLISGNITYPKG